MLDDKQIKDIFTRREAHLTGLHVVYASGLHGEEYLNKDAVLPFTNDTSVLCQELANRARHLRPDVVVAPVVGAVALAQWTAFHLSNLDNREVVAVYADKVTEEAQLRQDLQRFLELGDEVTKDGDAATWTSVRDLRQFMEAIRSRQKFVEHFELKRGYDKHVRGKRALVIEDVINTGGSIAKVIDVTRKSDGLVVGACGLANRGGVTAQDLDIPELITLLNVKMQAWKEEEMPEWLKRRPVATHVGKGAEWRAKKGRAAYEGV